MKKIYIAPEIEVVDMDIVLPIAISNGRFGSNVKEDGSSTKLINGEINITPGDGDKDNIVVGAKHNSMWE
jgi:hypothetical protein